MMTDVANVTNVIVVIGPGSIGRAIARRVGVGKKALLANSHGGVTAAYWYGDLKLAQ